jgi:hypothetical protein
MTGMRGATAHALTEERLIDALERLTSSRESL